MKPAIKILIGFVETSGGNRKMETEETKETGSVRGTKEEGIHFPNIFQGKGHTHWKHYRALILRIPTFVFWRSMPIYFLNKYRHVGITE